MAAEDWEKLSEKKMIKILEEVNVHIEPVKFQPASTSMRRRRLPFYQDHALLEISDTETTPPLRKYALYAPGDVRMITWKNDVIYTLNEDYGIDLGEQTVSAYLDFFLSYVRGTHGHFHLVESVDDISWKEEPPPQGRKVMQDMISPLARVGYDPQTGYELSGFFLFKDALFKTRIHISPKGIVELSDEELMIEGLPVLEDLAGAA